MAKDDRSAINPFTNKQHLDLVDDDKLLEQCYNEYYGMINSSQLLDDTQQGRLVRKIAGDLINAVEIFLAKIGRSDYTADYYDWEIHLVADHTVNAWCMPGGKMVMYSGMLGPANSEDDLALVLGHEMAHALLDHTRTQVSARNAKNAITTAAWIGSIGLSLFGMGELGSLTRLATNVADIGSEFLLLQPVSREHEFEADKLGMMLMHWAGYDISRVPDFWSRLTENNRNEFDFFSTHPADSKRIENMYALISEIEQGKDFYSVPVISEGNNTPTPQSNKVTCYNCGKLIDGNSKFCTYCGTDLENKNVIKCPQCGSLVSDNQFCTQCGANLKEKRSKRCFNCGNEVNYNDTFCTNCGTKL